MFCNILGVTQFDSKLATPFFYGGFKGVMRSTALCFFGYTSFEQPITVAEEAIRPQRDLPRSLIFQIILEMFQYSFLAFFVSCLIPIDRISEKAMIPNSLLKLGLQNSAYIVFFGSILGMLPTVLDSLLSQTRILYRGSKDGLISHKFQTIDPETQSPKFSIIVTGGTILLIVLFFDITFLE